MIRTTFLAAALGVFALTAAPLAPVLSDAPGMSAEAATAKKKPAKKRLAKRSNVQSKVTYDSRTQRYMTSGDYKYRYGR